MQLKLILFFSLVLAALGFALPVEWLAMLIGEKGELFIPVSSGSEDPFTIKVALMSFTLTIIYSGISMALKKGAGFAPLVYTINSLFYLLCMFLVSLDSNIIGAARHGNWAPVLQLVLWLASIIAICGATFNKLS